MKSDFFYSKSTELYVSRKPLKIDSRVKKAAEQAGVNLNWDDEGRISFVDFDDSRKILASLGAVMLSPVEYWEVLEDSARQHEFSSKIRASLDSLNSLNWSISNSIGIFFAGIGISFLGLVHTMIISGILGICVTLVYLFGLKKNKILTQI